MEWHEAKICTLNVALFTKLNISLSPDSPNLMFAKYTTFTVVRLLQVYEN